MSIMPEPTNNGEQINDSTVRDVAVRLAQLGYQIDPGAAVPELIDRINTLMAEGVRTVPESEWAQLPACPSWCTGNHPDDGQFRDCSSEEMFVPQPGDRVVCVDVSSTFNRAKGQSTAPTVRVEDYEFTPQYARHLARLLLRAADLIDG